MSKELKNNILKILLIVLYIVVGILLLIQLNGMLNFIESVLCAVLFVAGIIFIVLYALVPYENREYKFLLYGILCVGLGVLMIFVPRFFGIILSGIIGFGGFSLILENIKSKRDGNKMKIVDLIVGIVVCLLALSTLVLSIVYPEKDILAIIFGINLLVLGIYNLVVLIIIFTHKDKVVENGNQNLPE